MKKAFCPSCGCKRKIEVVKKEETYPIRGRPVSILSNVATCAACGEEILVPEYDNDNLCRAYAIYRRLFFFLSPEQSKSIRAQCCAQCSAPLDEFSEVLGLDRKTVERYENGTLQDDAVDNLLFLMQYPANYLRLRDRKRERDMMLKAIMKEEGGDVRRRPFGRAKQEQRRGISHTGTHFVIELIRGENNE